MSEAVPILLATLPFAFIVPAGAVFLREISKSLGYHDRDHKDLSPNEMFGIKVRAAMLPTSLVGFCATLYGLQSDATLDALVFSHAFAAMLTLVELNAAHRTWARIKKALVFFHFAEDAAVAVSESGSESSESDAGYIPSSFDHQSRGFDVSALHDELKTYLRK